jgi:ankyrin repeat protein
MGSDINAQDNIGDTPIHVALERLKTRSDANIMVLTYLLTQKGISVNLKGQFGHTLLHRACKHINNLPLDVFKALIETHGADVNVQDIDKNTPLHCALYRFTPRDDGDVTALTYLLSQKGVNVNIKGKYGYTLLHLACICDTSDLDDLTDPKNDFTEDNSTDSDDDLRDNVVELNAKSDTHLCRIVEMIAGRFV